MCCHSKAKLRPEVGPPTRRAKASAAPLFFVGRHAPRRMRRFCQLKSKSFAPGRAAYRSAKSATRTAFFVGGATRGECDVLPLKSKSFAPRSGLLQEEPTRQPHRFFLWGGTPRGECGMCCHSKAKLRPEVGPPTEEPKLQPHRFFCGSRAPRRMRRFCPLISKSFAPRSGLLQKRQSATRTAFFVGAATCGGQGFTARSKSKSFAPRSGLLQKSQKRHSHRLCGRRASRRIQASESLSRAAPRSVRRARRSRRRRAETGYARLAPRRSSEPRPRLPPAAFQVAMR